MDEAWQSISEEDARLSRQENSAALVAAIHNYQTLVTTRAFNEEETNIRFLFHDCADAMKFRWGPAIEVGRSHSQQLGLSSFVGPCWLEGLCLTFSRKRGIVAEPAFDDPCFFVLHDPGAQRAFAVSQLRGGTPKILRLKYDGTRLVGLKEHLLKFAEALNECDIREVPPGPAIALDGYSQSTPPRYPSLIC